MSNAETRSDRSIDYERPSVDAPLVGHEWTEYRCCRCGEHCINRSDGGPVGRELCLDCFAVETSEESPATAGTPTEEEGVTRRSAFGSVRSSLANVAARLSGD